MTFWNIIPWKYILTFHANSPCELTEPFFVEKQEITNKQRLLGGPKRNDIQMDKIKTV